MEDVDGARNTWEPITGDRMIAVTSKYTNVNKNDISIYTERDAYVYPATEAADAQPRDEQQYS